MLLEINNFVGKVLDRAAIKYKLKLGKSTKTKVVEFLNQNQKITLLETHKVELTQKAQRHFALLDFGSLKWISVKIDAYEFDIKLHKNEDTCNYAKAFYIDNVWGLTNLK